jgi:hypothetical protein
MLARLSAWEKRGAIGEKRGASELIGAAGRHEAVARLVAQD